MPSTSPGPPKSSSRPSTSSSSSSESNRRPPSRRRPPIIVSSDSESEPEPVRRPQTARSPGESSPKLEIDNGSLASGRGSLRSVSPDASWSPERLGQTRTEELGLFVVGGGYERVESDWGSAFGSDSDPGSGFESGESGRIDRNRGLALEDANDKDRELLFSGYDDGESASDPGSGMGGEDEEREGDGSEDDSGEGSEEELQEEEASPRAHSLELTSDNGEAGPTDASEASEPNPEPAEDGVFIADSEGILNQGSDMEPSLLHDTPRKKTFEGILTSPQPPISLPNITRDNHRALSQEPNPKRVRIPGRRRGKQIDRFNPEYVEVLNDAISSANSRELCSEGRRILWGSFVVGSWWSRDEKHKFFNLIATNGRHDATALARRMKTKSVVECRAYLKVLREAVEDANDYLGYKAGRLPRMDDIPAAVEVSEECIAVLEEAAQLLENRTVADEQGQEKRRWGSFWLLDCHASEHIEDLYEDECLEEIHDIAPEAELLNIYNMLELSEGVFMNSPQENWRFLGDKRPSIRYTAFIDLHTLVLSFTRRLVSTAIFMAESRLRCTDAAVLNPNRVFDLRTSDVEAATNTLGLASNTKEYWTKLPRRLGLDIIENRHYVLKGRRNVIAPYDEVERFLRSSESFKFPPRPAAPKFDPQEANDEGEEFKKDHRGSDSELDDFIERTPSDPSSTETSDDEDEDEDDGIVLNPEIQHEPNKTRKRLDREYQAYVDREEAYLEALDQKRSQEEETRLWQLLGQQPTGPSPEVTEVPGPLKGRRKRPADIHDWVDDVEYFAPWEGFKKPRVDKKSEAMTVPRAKMLEFSTVVSVKEEGDGKGKGNGKGKGKEAVSEVEKRRKKKSAPKRSPRVARVRRPAMAYSGYVSTVENVPVDSGAEEADDESDSEHQEKGVEG